MSAGHGTFERSGHNDCSVACWHRESKSALHSQKLRELSLWRAQWHLLVFAAFCANHCNRSMVSLGAEKWLPFQGTQSAVTIQCPRAKRCLSLLAHNVVCRNTPTHVIAGWPCGIRRAGALAVWARYASTAVAGTKLNRCMVDVQKRVCVCARVCVHGQQVVWLDCGMHPLALGDLCLPQEYGR
jgi:hypothetical protein